MTTKVTENAEFINGANNWSFENSGNHFGNDYTMNQKYSDKLMSSLNNTEKEEISEFLSRKWGGSCYGMAATSILSCYDILKPSEWQKGANFLSDIDAPPTADVESLINYYHVLQKTDYVQQYVASAIYSDDEAGKLQNLLDCLKDGSPTLLCFHGNFWGDSWTGHAVVAYDVEYGTWVKNGSAYNGRVLIYDNNKVDFNDDYCLYFNTSKMNWTIPHYELNSDTNAILGLVTDDIDVINYHGYINGSDQTSTDPFISVLTSKQISADYSLRKVTMNNGTWTSAATSEDDIKMFSSLSDVPGKESDIKFALKDSEKGYVMKLDSPESLDLSMRYENSLLDAEASNASQALFDPSGYIEISGENSDYAMSMVENEGYYPTDWYKLVVAGENADKVTIEKTENGYIMSGDNLEKVGVRAQNDGITARRGFSTEYNEVFIYEIDEKTIGVAVDTDGNGTFETELASKYGDVNADNDVSIADIVSLNQYMINAEGNSLSEYSLANADCQRNGIIDSTDCTILVNYIVMMVDYDILGK